MKRIVLIMLAAAAVGVVLGVGSWNTRYSNDPVAPRLAAPDPAAEETLVAGPDGEALKCNGKLAKVKVDKIPSLTPAEVKVARKQASSTISAIEGRPLRDQGREGDRQGQWVRETGETSTRP